jgi:DNA-binding NtrC family response regulator
METNTAFIGGHKVISRLRKELPKMAKSASQLLIIGPAGAGKTHLARILHEYSGRPSLSILHPHTADSNSIAESFARARASAITLLIQDIEEFSFLYQAALVKEIAQMDQKSQSRIIVTSKCDPENREMRNRPSEELGELLDSMETVRIPSLEARRDDIPLFVEEFIRRSCESAKLEFKTVDINTLDFLTKQPWEGNVRQLRSLIEQLVLQTEGSVVTLPREMSDEFLQLKGILSQISGKKRFSFDDSLGYLERTLIERALEVADFNQVKAAHILNLSEANFRYRLKKFNIPQSRKRS